MQSLNPEFSEFVGQPSAERGTVRRMSGTFLINAAAKSISIDESFAGQLTHDEVAHQEWLEKVRKLREASGVAAI